MSLLCAVVTGEDRLFQAAVGKSESFPDGATLTGRVIVQAADGGVLLEDRMGRYFNLTPDMLESLEPIGGEFGYFGSEELGTTLRNEMGTGFFVVTTEHYVICSNASELYVRWCGKLFERLRGSFLRYWQRAGLELVPSKHPLPILLFADRDQFEAHATMDAGASAAASLGYYSTRSNRTVMYDLTRTASGPAKTSRDIIRQLLRSPFSIATVIHEATHQIAFNTGMHRRFSDNPVWLTEGMAMYFETPDLSSRSGWRAIGQENPFRIASLKGIPANDASLDLSSLIGSDQLFTDPRTAVNAYAVSWAFSRFLLTTRRREYLAFLEHVAGRKPLDFGSPQRRISEFEEHVEELSTLQPAFNRYLRALLR